MIINRIAVLGAGSVGQALAGHLQLRGYHVSLWNRSPERTQALTERGGVVQLQGVIEGDVQLSRITSDLAEAVDQAELIFVTCSADGHQEIGSLLGHCLSPTVRAIVLVPGRTFGGIVFRQALGRAGAAPLPPIYETQTVVHTCRQTEGGCQVFRIKKGVRFSSFYDPQFHMAPLIQRAVPELVLEEDPRVIPFYNLGCILHPAVMLLNFARVEAGEPFRFYVDGITPGVARYLQKVDAERLLVARAAGVNVPSIEEWLQSTYDLGGGDLYQLVHSNTAYSDIPAPRTPHHRYIFEDVPTGLVPLTAIGDVLNVDTPFMDGLIRAFNYLMGTNFKLAFTLDKGSVRRLLHRQRVAG